MKIWEFISPEELEKKQYIPKKSEVWSLGIMLFFIVFRDFPWRAKSEIGINNNKKKSLKFVNKFSKNKIFKEVN